jgi:hypothetical protein
VAFDAIGAAAKLVGADVLTVNAVQIARTATAGKLRWNRVT